ncbi:glycosyltransferase family A protein [Streptomyces sp. B6B3]|uniref:glycosyltransferase family 2 protein n=1 Tax=Streptomyces sp. B6B3 TaxID=3153570 RepID=UPI00325E2CD8
MSPAEIRPPVVSVLMPTYRQGAFIARALGSLFDQSYQDFEVVIVNDGSDDDTEDQVLAYDDPRIRYIAWAENRGLGAALNAATAAAGGDLLCYLPSDDHYDPDHLETCVTTLRDRPDAGLVYSGVRWVRRDEDVAWGPAEESATLREDVPVGGEDRIHTAMGPEVISRLDVRSGNFLALVQVMHRRSLTEGVRWRERTEIVSDSLEVDFWSALLKRGVTFAYTGSATCEWGDHPDQRHKIISGRGTDTNQLSHGYGISRYRQFYRVPSGQLLNWQPVREGIPIDERTRYGGVAPAARSTGRTGMRILVTGAMAYGPEQLVALEEAGHRLAGLWSEKPHFWETGGPLPFGDITWIPDDAHWQDRVREFAPDVVYGLMNWPNLPLLHRVWRAGLAPFVVHFKESPMAAMQTGMWPMLRDLMLRSAGRVFHSEDLQEWFRRTIGPSMPEGPSIVMDGDLPKRDLMTNEWAPALSDLSEDPEETHTVCIGRIFLEPMAELAKRKIHVHHYGALYRRWASGWTAEAGDNACLHPHARVGPQDWVRELSRYDAAWLYVFSSSNRGNIRSASWEDLNYPARLHTYALAGLPWIQRDNTGHVVSTERLARELGVGILYRDVDHLAELLREEKRTRRSRTSMRAAREAFTFDYHVPRLTEFFRSLTD